MPRNRPHPLPEHVRPHGSIISFVYQYGEWVGRLQRLGRNRFMLGEGWLAPDPGIVRILVRRSAWRVKTLLGAATYGIILLP